LSFKTGKEWKEVNNFLVSRKSFQDVVRELEGNFYVLHEKGEEISEMEIKENPIFILGDNQGIPKKDEEFVLRKGSKISLGKESYLSSACITVLNWICDKKLF
jgi:tRNA (pseudouridine54-N1)-methyltransferase